MAVMATGGIRRSTPRVASALSALTGVLIILAKKAVSPHRAALKNLYDIPLTVAAAGCVDYSAFHLGGGWGWLVTGLSLLAVENLIADEK